MATARKATAAAAVDSDDTTASVIQISRIQTETMLVPIIGTSPLIVHRFSEKAKKQMLDAMQGNKRVKENKNPQAEYEAAFYRFTDGRYGFPVIAFKNATVGGARFYSGITMVQLRQAIFVNGETGPDGDELAVIQGTPVLEEVDKFEDPDPFMREDVVRVGQGGTDLRYRPQFTDWRTTLQITYVKSQLSKESVLSLVDAGGMGVGVGEWRPEKKGDKGTFTIDESREVKIIRSNR